MFFVHINIVYSQCACCIKYYVLQGRSADTASCEDSQPDVNEVKVSNKIDSYVTILSYY